MSINHRLIALISLILHLTVITACALPAPVARLFATETPTATPTPTTTPTPTVTPLPPLDLQPCPRGADCPGAVGIYDIITGDVESGVEYSVDVPYDQAVSFHAGWLVQDDFILTQNMEHMQHFVEIDGVNYWQDYFLGSPAPFSYDNDPTVYSSIWQGVVISGWKVGQPHRVRIGFTFDEQITDGWEVYPKGTVIEFLYNINPVVRPTDTPTPTATFTPVPTATPVRPTAIPYTSTPSCSENATITINNTTGGKVTLYLNGPAKYTFSLGTGYTYLKVCSGSYSYTAYGCGGANDTGTINGGEEHEFYCY